MEGVSSLMPEATKGKEQKKAEKQSRNPVVQTIETVVKSVDDALNYAYHTSTRYVRSKTSIELRYAIMLFVATRVVLTMIGVWSRGMLVPYFPYNSGWIYSDNIYLDIWGIWDSGWYLHIADFGYWEITNPGTITDMQTPYAFFPLYPMLIRGLGFATGDNFVAGIIISNVALFVGSLYLFKLVRFEDDEATALRSMKYMYLFPVAFIFSGVFTESLFVMLMIMCFYYAKKGNWAFVGVLGLFIGLTKTLGIVVLIPIFYEYLKMHSYRIKPDVLYLGLFPAGVALFSRYCYTKTGDYLAFMHAQGTWGRTFSNPIAGLDAGFANGNFYIYYLAYFSLFFIILLFVFARRIGFTYFLLGALLIFIPLSTGVLAMPRFILSVFPFFIMFARLGKNQALDTNLTIACALLQGFFMVFWVAGFWLIA